MVATDVKDEKWIRTSCPGRGGHGPVPQYPQHLPKHLCRHETHTTDVTPSLFQPNKLAILPFESSKWRVWARNIRPLHKNIRVSLLFRHFEPIDSTGGGAPNMRAHCSFWVLPPIGTAVAVFRALAKVNGKESIINHVARVAACKPVAPASWIPPPARPGKWAKVDRRKRKPGGPCTRYPIAASHKVSRRFPSHSYPVRKKLKHS